MNPASFSLSSAFVWRLCSARSSRGYLPPYHTTSFAPLVQIRVSRLSCGARRIISGVLLELVALFGLGAQSSQSSSHDITSFSPDSARWATITTDTGDMVPGPDDFSRYTNWRLCYAAALRTRATLQRTLATQAMVATLQKYTPERDMLPDSEVTVARKCSAHFSVERIAGAELPGYLALALLTQDDSLLHAVFQRRLAMTHDSNAVIQATIGAYLTADPARLAAADSLIAQIDARGSAALVVRLVAHGQRLVFLQRYMDQALARAEAERIIALAHEGNADEVTQSAGFDVWMAAYRTLMNIAFVQHPDSMLAIAHRAVQDFRRSPIWVENTANKIHSDVDSVMLLALKSAEWNDSAGKPNVPLQADYWIPSKPTPEALNLEISISANCLVFIGIENYNEQECSDQMEQLQQWQQRYGAVGLHITVIALLHGGAFYSDTLSPPDEARTIAWYVRDYWRLPVSVAMVNAKMPEEERQYWQWFNYTIVRLTNQDGKRVYGYSDNMYKYTQDKILTKTQVSDIERIIQRTLMVSQAKGPPNRPSSVSSSKP
jgi:hypothetical protein